MRQLDPLIDVLERSPNTKTESHDNYKKAYVKDMHFNVVTSMAERRGIELICHDDYVVVAGYDHYITWEE